MWITGLIQRKHSLSTCGQTVCKYEEVIHIFDSKKTRQELPKLLTVHAVLSFVFAAGHQTEAI